MPKPIATDVPQKSNLAPVGPDKGSLNLLMLSNVAGLLLDARHAAVIRSAGLKGAEAYEECVNEGNAPMCIVDIDQFPHLDRPPFRVPIGPSPEATRLPVQTMIVSIAAMRYEGRDPQQSSYYEAFDVSDVIFVMCDDLLVASQIIQASDPLYVTFVSDKPYRGVPAKFMSMCTSVVTARFVVAWGKHEAKECLKKVGTGGIVIDEGFMSNCSALAYMDFAQVQRIAEVRAHFLTNCICLKEINLSPLANITRIATGFMAGNESLTSLDLSPLSKVQVISSEFLAGCTGLKSINISSFSNVTEIGERFMAACWCLEGIDLHPLSNVTDVGPWFLSCCKRIPALDMSRMDKLAEIPMGLMEEFKNRKVLLPPGLCPTAVVEAQNTFDIRRQGHSQDVR